MDMASDSDIELKFAKKLIAQMLIRRGAKFKDDVVHRLLIDDGERPIALVIKYISDEVEERVQQQWLEDAANLGVGTSTPAIENHLVLVSGQGYDIFTDEKVAAHLCPDMKTRIHVRFHCSTLRERPFWAIAPELATNTGQ